MKILVTGSSGFFGSWLIPALEEAGHEVKRFDLVQGDDILDGQAVSVAMRGCQAVIHLAGIPHWDETIRAVDYERVNVNGTTTVFDRFLKRKTMTHFVYTSSGALYGFGPGRDKGWVKPPIQEEQEPVADETDLDDYGWSKIAAERELIRTPKTKAVTSLRINCIEPHDEGVLKRGDHWGWRCTQALAIEAYLAALRRTDTSYLAVNVAEECKHVDRSALLALLERA